MNSERKKNENICQFETIEAIKSRLRTTKKENWSTVEFFQWILFYFIPDYSIDDIKIAFEMYQYLNGEILSKMNPEDMEKIDAEYGIMIYNAFIKFNTSDELKNNNPLFKRSSSAIRNLTNQRLVIWLVKSFIPENSIPFYDFNFKAFSHYDGESLIRKSCDEMNKMDPKYGKLLYDKLNDLNNFCDYQQTKTRAVVNNQETLPKLTKKDNKPVVQSNELEIDLSMFSSQIGANKNEELSLHTFNINIPSFNLTPLSPPQSDDIFMYDKSSDSAASSSKSSEEFNDSKRETRQTRNQVLSTSRLQRALQLVDDDSDNEEMSVNKSNLYNYKKMKNCVHLWQFLRDLLQDEKFNPSIITWIDVKKGVFKVVEPNSVSQMWAFKKGRKSMSYENLSRGLRHSRKNGYFRQVAPMSCYGKKLVYQFGPKSIQHCKWLQEIVETK